MSYYLSLNLHPKQSLKTTQRLIMSPQMQQAIQFLQLPLQELELVIEEELQRNPLLDCEEEEVPEEREHLEQEEEERTSGEEEQLSFEDENFKVLRLLDEEFRDHFAESGPYQPRGSEEDQLRTFLENSIREESSLFEFLMKQAQETFETAKELQQAEWIIGNFDSSGYLSSSLEEIAQLNDTNVEELEKVLKRVQAFEPYGVGARSIQESLLIQLRCLGKEQTLAYRIIRDHYDSFLHHHLRNLQRQLKCTPQQLSEALFGEISKLRLHPGKSRSKDYVPLIVPDLSIIEDDGQWRIVVHDESVPPLRLNRKYLRLLDQDNLPKETVDFIRSKVNSAKWLMRNLYQRNETLYRIAEALLKHQQVFFKEPNGNLEPLTMKTLAEELELHESTIARAVANKYIDTPRGLLPLRFFFSHAYVSEEGEDISARTVKEEIRRSILNEDKSHPLSDELISSELKKKGINCARRTVAKYRLQLGFGNTHQRRRFETEVDI